MKKENDILRVSYDNLYYQDSNALSDDMKNIFFPYREGYQFMGWYMDAEFTRSFFKYIQPIFDMPMLYARWEAILPEDILTITFDTQGGSELQPMMYSKRFGTTNLDIDKPVKAGHVFEDWYFDPEYKLPFLYSYHSDEN